MKIVDLVADSEKVDAHFRCSGTHLGEWMGHPPTGRRFHNVDEIYIFRVTARSLLSLRGACLARAVARAFIRDCCVQPTVPRTAVSYAIASARQPTTTQSDRILLQLTEYVSGEYVTLPVRGAVRAASRLG